MWWIIIICVLIIIWDSHIYSKRFKDLYDEMEDIRDDIEEIKKKWS